MPASPTCFSAVFSLFAQSVVVIQPAFRFFKEEIVPYVAVDAVCPREEATPGPSDVSILNQNSKLNTLKFYLVELETRNALPYKVVSSLFLEEHSPHWVAISLEFPHLMGQGSAGGGGWSLLPSNSGL